MNMAGIDLKHDGMIWVKEKAAMTSRRAEQGTLHSADQGITIDLMNDRFQYKFVLKPIYKIVGIRKNSPAAAAGVKEGDILLRINGKAAGNLALAKILGKLRTHPGDEVRLLLQRGEEEIRVRFYLEDPIPFLEK